MAEFQKTRPLKEGGKKELVFGVLSELLNTSINDNSKASVKGMLRLCEASASLKKKQRKVSGDFRLTAY